MRDWSLGAVGICRSVYDVGGVESLVNIGKDGSVLSFGHQVHSNLYRSDCAVTIVQNPEFRKRCTVPVYGLLFSTFLPVMNHSPDSAFRSGY